MYLLKSGACLAILFVFYKLVLENENMHQFKRFYLLGMLVISFGIPLITFTTYVEALESTPLILTSISSETQQVETTSFLDFLPSILGTVYFIGVLFFSFRFIKNLSQILLKIKQNQKVKFTDYINVLLTEKVIPHTFFSYIFLNKQKYDLQEIPSEVILHEQTHAKQRHSFDVLFIELLQIVFWFNPFIYFIKHSIKLNHEFLADQAVLNQGIDSSLYQNILLAFSSDATTPQMANAINYSSIKKRFTVMKTQTSKSRIWARSLLLLPLLAILIYSFSTKIEVEKSKSNQGNNIVSKSKVKSEDIIVNINKDKTFTVNEISTTVKELPSVLNKFNQNLSKKLRNENVKVTIESDESVSMSFLRAIEDVFYEYGIEKFYIPGSLSDMSFSQKSATKAQLAEYNKLAKKYNNQDKEDRIVLMKDLERLEYIYNLMTPEQKATAEPFPDCFPPPPPFVSLKPIDHIVKMAKNNAAFFYENERVSSDKAISLLKENSNLNIETNTFKNSNPIVKITKHGVNNSNKNIPPPPAPPVPPTPPVPPKPKKGSN